jgi:hypothetical protein
MRSAIIRVKPITTNATNARREQQARGRPAICRNSSTFVDAGLRLPLKASRQRDMGEDESGLEHRETSHRSFERSMTRPERAGPSATYIEAIGPSVLRNIGCGRAGIREPTAGGWPFARQMSAFVVVGPSGIAEDSQGHCVSGCGTLTRHQLNLIKSLKPYCRGSVGFARTGRNETTTPLLRVAFGCWPICIPGPFRMIC